MLPALRSAVTALAVSAVASGSLAGSSLASGSLAGSSLAAGALARPATGLGSTAPARAVAAPGAVAAPRGVVAAAGELVDASTGKWLWSRGMYTRHPIASITKIMTAMVVISAGDLNRKIRVTEAAVQYARANSAGSAGLIAGDVLTARQLLEGMLLPSGADAAYLLANAYGRGWRAFVRKMNARARKLGMTGTHFANFDGLPWPTPTSGYSTPRDLIILGEAAMKVPLLRQIVGQRSHWIGATSQHHHYDWKNTNLLLGSFSGAIGIKTGFTRAAGYCLLFAAIRGKREIMGVVLDSTGSDTAMRFAAAKRLLAWGFTVTKPKPRPSPPPSPSPSPSRSASPSASPSRSASPSLPAG